jgi:hypothetical protein
MMLDHAILDDGTISGSDDRKVDDYRVVEMTIA